MASNYKIFLTRLNRGELQNNGRFNSELIEIVKQRKRYDFNVRKLKKNLTCMYTRT